MTDEEIRKRVRARLANGTLPRELPTGRPLTFDLTPAQMMIGSAYNDPCVVCDERSTQTRYDTPRGPVAFHDRCHEIWEEERHKPIRREDRR